MNSYNTNNSEGSAMQLLQDINSGIIDPKLLDKQSRQQCVELLVAEGYSYFQMAQLLKCSEKTIGRDLKDIRRRNELTPNLEFAKQLIGEVFQKAMNHHNYLMRLARMKEATISEKMQSEFAAWKVIKELTERFQSLGFLPTHPKEIIGNFYSHSNADEDNSPETMRKMLLNIEQTAEESGLVDSEITAKVNLLKARIAQSEIATEIKLLEGETLKNKERDNEENHN